MTSSRNPGRPEAVSRFALEGDTYRLARELMDAAILGEIEEAGEVGALDEIRRISDTLLSLSDFHAAKLANDIVHLYRATVMREWVRHGWSEHDCRGHEHSLWNRMARLKELLINGLPSVRSLAGRLREVDDLGRSFTLDTPHNRELWRIIEKDSELAAGTMPSTAFVATLRRTARKNGYEPRGIKHLSQEQVAHPLLNPGEAWTDHALGELPGLHESWPPLLRHALTATAVRPTAAWNARAKDLIDDIGPETVHTTVVSWLGMVDRPRTVPLVHNGTSTFPGMLDPYNAVAVRGLVWLLALTPESADSARVLGHLVDFCVRKVPGLGPRHPRIANAAVHTLRELRGEASLGELARLSARLTAKPTLKLVDAALDSRATTMGVSREEIEELALPGYGLTGVGHGEHVLGDTTAVLSVRDGKASLTWRGTTGRVTKTAPAPVRRDHAEDVKALKAAAKDIDKMLTAQSTRLERLCLARRTWTFPAWRERYADHPLLGTLTRRLLWSVDGVTCGYADGQWRALDDSPVRAAPDARVELWHPVAQDPDEVLAWRDWLRRHGITQPFKQAHREVYRLTGAERQTRDYSNRFAAHILRQHQFNALAAARGWRNRLRMAVDDVYPPATIDLPAWGLRGEYWIEGIDDDVAGSGSFLTVRTDQVRFYPLDAPQNLAHAGGGAYTMPGESVDPLPLERIPDLVLSEVLRDVDLFVGVASVGNDPTWQDGGPGGRFQHYWNAYAFGELSQPARTRKELLAALLPRLGVADRCGIDGRYLTVRGTLHTYRIHLGSGNILMSPDNTYLCVVPAPGNAPPVGDTYLPFEGDRMLAVILSKAIMLADDTAITDPSVVGQLQRGEAR
ncbi:DUF4132 domain-containing protein [Streptomyces sp. H51]|uniref:DUF4132 domain-containing protein n=1 Tax=Streptomyces sp. H51 TaxID=3111770 RepID=UPI002D7732C3|nr:DUF4132 domain-containing protein [Streptomyces sp. H51]